MFSVRVGVHRDPCLSTLLFTTVLEALSQEFRAGCSWEKLYGDDLVIMCEPESPEILQEKLIFWKSSLKGKGLRVSMSKINVLIFGPGLETIQKPGKIPGVSLGC